MGKKGTFKLDNITSDKRYSDLKCKDKIVWFKDNQAEQEELAEYYKDFLKLYPVPTYTNSGLLSTDFIDSCTFIGRIPLETQLKNVEGGKDIWNIYLVTDNEYKNIYLSVDITSPIFWIKYSSRKVLFENIDLVLETYQSLYTLDFEKEVRGFIGTQKMLDLDLDSIEQHFILNNFTEYLMWGSKWRDHPFRKTYINREVTSAESVFFTTQAMKQLDDNTKRISVRTNFSKSIITVEDHDGAYVVNIKYNPTFNTGLDEVNRIFMREYPDDLPLDVVVSIVNFPFITHTGLLQLDPITEYNFIMAFLVANTTNMYEEMLPYLENIATNSDQENLKIIATNYYTRLKQSIGVDKILEDQQTEQFIKDKISDLNKGKDENEIQKEILEEIDRRLDSLKIRDKCVKEYLTGIVEGLIKNK